MAKLHINPNFEATRSKMFRYGFFFLVPFCNQE